MSALKCVSAHEDSLVCELPLCLEVLYVGEWSTSFKLADQKKLRAKCKVQLSLGIETQMFKYLLPIYFDHELRKQSYFTESKPS